MKTINSLIFLVTLYNNLIKITRQSQAIYISSESNPNCLLTDPQNICDGELNNPYDSLLFMLNNFAFQDNESYDIMFLGSSNTAHYVLPYIENYYDYRSTSNNYLINNNNITLNFKPAYCTNTVNGNGNGNRNGNGNSKNNGNGNGNSNSKTNSYSDCVIDTSTSLSSQPTMIIYLKTIDFSISMNTLNIQDLIFDGTDLFLYNTNNNNDYCLSQRTLCCGTNVDCESTISNLMINIETIFYGIFVITEAIIQNAIFQNIFSVNLSSLFLLNPSSNLIISNTQFNNIYFPSGIVSNNNSNNDASILYINITLVSVSNYNYLNLITNNMLPIEGYFINFPVQFQGYININNSLFINMTNSFLQTTCSEVSIMFAGINSQEPYLQSSDIEKFPNYQGYSTGVIAISSLNGILIMINNTFSNIAGFSGTSLVIMNMIEGSLINITNNTFSNNFAIANTATIKIYQTPQGSNFANSAYCQPIILDTNIFTNNYGCPGASGNAVIYCNTKPLSGTQPLDNSTPENQLDDFQNILNSNKMILTIINNQFQSNYLVYSNSLLVYGFAGINLTNNLFNSNGVQTSQNPIELFSYQNLGQNANIVWTTTSTLFSWQSTTVLFLSLFANLKMNSNTFSNNWAINSLSTLRGSQMVIDSMILIGTSNQFWNNSFIDNTGVPSNQITSNSISVPLITINFANISNYLSTFQASSINQFIIDSSNFNGNIFNYITSYTYQSSFSTNINDYVTFIRFYDENERNIANPIWTIINTDAQIQFVIQNCLFFNNQIITTLSSSGIFFLNNIVQNMIIRSSNFSSNILIWLQSNAVTNPSGLSSTPTCYTTMICWYLPIGGQSSDFIFSMEPSLIGIWNNMQNSSLTSSLNITNCVFFSNIGQLFNTNSQLGGITMNYIALNNIFQNNEGYTGIEKLFTWKSSLVSIKMSNNIFNWTQNIEVIMLFTICPLGFIESFNSYINNNVNLAIKYFIYNQNPSSVSTLPQGFHSSISIIYINNSISLSQPVSSLYSISSMVTIISNNINLTYTEQNSTISLLQALNSTYVIINQTNFILNNLSYSSTNNAQTFSIVFLANSLMIMSNCNLNEYPIIDISRLVDGWIVSQFVILSYSSQIQLINNSIEMFMGIVNATQSTVTIANMSSIANFQINVDETLLSFSSYIPNFGLVNSYLSILNSIFEFDNSYLQATSSNISINNCKLADQNGDSLYNWGSNVFKTENTTLFIINSNLSNIVTKFGSNTSHITMNNCIIWGYITNTPFTFELNQSNLIFYLTTFQNTFGNIISDTPCRITFQNTNHITGGISSNCLLSQYIFDTVNFSNADFNLFIVNGRLTIQNSIFNENLNPNGIKIDILNGSTILKNTSFTDNLGYINISQSLVNSDSIICSGSGPFLNSGGILLNILNSNISSTGMTMISNYATINIVNSIVNFLNFYIEENYTNTNSQLQNILSLFILTRSNVLIQNSQINYSFELMSSLLSNITILDTVITQNTIQQLSNQIFRFKSSNIEITNCKFLSYNITKGILLFLNSPKLNLQKIYFQNNIVRNSTLLSITPAVTCNLDQLLFQNNTLTNSKNLMITLAEDNQILLSNSIFLDKSDRYSYHLYFKSHSGITKIMNCSFSGASQQIFLSTLSNLAIFNMTIFYDQSVDFTNTSTPRYLIYMENNPKVSLNNSLFEGLTAYLGVINRKSFASELFIIENCTFKNNKAFQGSALNNIFYSNDSKIIIQNSKFINNSAKIPSNINISSSDYPGYGGSILSTCSSNDFCNFSILNTIFQNNTADSIAGAIYTFSFPPFVDINTVQFIDNEAPYGPDMATDPVQFIVVDPNTTVSNKGNYDWQKLYFSSDRILQQNTVQSSKFISEIVSGRLSPSLLVVYSLDLYQQVAGTDNKTEITLSFSDAEFSNATYDGEKPDVIPLTNITLMKVENGVFKCDNALLSFWPGSNASAILKVSGLNELPPYIKSRIDPSVLAQMNKQINLKFEFRNCIMGEVFLDTGVCMSCGLGFYSLVIPNNSKIPCSTCDFDTSYCLGGAKVAPRRGYWRKNVTGNLVIKCPNNDACLGNNNSVFTYIATGLCAPNYTGNLCNICPDGQINDGEACVKCINNIWYYIRFFLALSIQAIFIFLIIKSTLGSLRSINDQRAMKISKIKLRLSVSARILVNFIQMLVIISAFNLEWPNLFSYLLEFNDQIMGNSKYYLLIDCFLLLFLNEKNGGSESLTYTKYITIFVSSIGLLLLSCALWLLVYAIKRKKIRGNSKFKRDIFTTLIILCFVFQPNMIRYALTIFQCINLYRDDNPEYYLTSNYEIKCYTFEYTVNSLILGGTTFVIWGMLLPCFIFLYLNHYKKKLDYDISKYKFAFLYIGYKKHRYYWELFIMFKKILIMAYLVFFRLISIKLQGWFLFITLFISFIMQIKYSPVKNEQLDKLKERGDLCLAIYGFGVLYFVEDKQIDIIAYNIIALCFISNIWFLLGWSRFYLKHQWLINNNLKIFQFIAKILKFKEKEKKESRESSQKGELKDKLNDEFFSNINGHTNDLTMRIKNCSNLDENSIDLATNKPFVERNVLNVESELVYLSKFEDLDISEHQIQIELSMNNICPKSHSFRAYNSENHNINYNSNKINYNSNSTSNDGHSKRKSIFVTPRPENKNDDNIIIEEDIYPNENPANKDIKNYIYENVIDESSNTNNCDPDGTSTKELVPEKKYSNENVNDESNIARNAKNSNIMDEKIVLKKYKMNDSSLQLKHTDENNKYESTNHENYKILNGLLEEINKNYETNEEVIPKSKRDKNNGYEILNSITPNKENYLNENIIDETIYEENCLNANQADESINQQDYLVNENINDDDNMINETIINETINKENILGESVVDEKINKESILNENIVDKTLNKESLLDENIVDITINKENLVDEQMINKADSLGENIDDTTIKKGNYLNENVVDEQISKEIIDKQKFLLQ